MKKSFLLFVFTSLLLMGIQTVNAQKKKKSDDPAIPAKEKPEIKSIEETAKKCRKYEGLFTIYQDTASGAAYLFVKKEQIGKQFIYFSHTADGVMAAGHIRGAYNDSKIFSVKRYFNRIEFITVNYSYYFDPKNELSRSASANISPAVMASLAIVGEDKKSGDLLIKADELFLSEAIHQVKPSPRPNDKPGSRFTLGNLNKDKTKYASIRSYPMNTMVEVEYVYDNPAPMVNGGADVTDDRYVSLRFLHTLIELPQNDFKPRKDDPRVGYFNTQMEDMTSPSTTPYRDFINRWHLVKKDKGAALSEPVEPITWWIENTTPREYRQTIREAALTWNQAFEAAGFRNAIVVKEQPDTATWDAGDIRYNVLRWVSSPKPAYGGYGPSFTDPRTGQILGADIMLEYVFITNRLKMEKLFETAGLIQAEETDPQKACALGDHLHNSTMFGTAMLTAAGAGETEKSELIKAGLYYLILHELGHTFGLNHNMKSSQLHPYSEIHNKDLTSKIGLTGSVMDYPAINFASDRSKQGLYYTLKPGPYDNWAIEFGYSEPAATPEEETKRLEKILSRSVEPQLVFGNDADDMRSPGKAIDPRVNINDMSSDAVVYAIERMKLAESLIAKLKEKFSKPGQSYHEMRNAFLIATNEMNNQAAVISRYIGGVMVDRSFIGQPAPAKPFVPVAYKDQKKAMEALARYVFSPTSMAAPNDLFNYLQMQRRGFNFYGNNEDPKIHDRFLNIQKGVLDHVLHSSVLLRIVDSEIYGNQYKLPEYMNDLTNAIFKDDIAGPVNSFRQNLQVEYVKRLVHIVGSSAYCNHAVTHAYAQLRAVEKMVTLTPGTDSSTKAHRQYVAYLIKKALDDKK